MLYQNTGVNTYNSVPVSGMIIATKIGIGIGISISKISVLYLVLMNRISPPLNVGKQCFWLHSFSPQILILKVKTVTYKISSLSNKP